MSFHASSGTATRRPRSAALAAAFVGAGLVAVLGYESLVAPSSSATAPVAAGLAAQPPHARPHTQPLAHHVVDESDGLVPGGVSVFDDRFPAVTRLDPDLLTALRRAGTDAADGGLELDVNSGWRSPAYQTRLLDEAVSRYGSEAEARRWVATPETSSHVAGEAVDIGPHEAADWLADHGSSYGLCRVYDNEPWHYELHPEAIADGCPATYADAAHDPRMR
jgi:hypothetical protein